MANWFQFFWGMAIFGYCSGSDCMAGKGWVLTEIEKDGFKIWIVNLHTDAGESLSDRQARKNQLTKLRFNLIILRQTFPHHVLFVMGDFNIYDHKDQYRKFLIDLLGQGEAGGRDADRNSPGFTIGCEEDCEHWTYSTDNDLAWHFDDESPSGRLDYIFYFPSWDGSVEVLPTYVNVLPFRGRTLSEDDVTTNESSDHWAVHGKFKLIRR
jgi:endonuclease/exonuclease/phosphatase family metal-dependent hydrolase